MDNRAPYKRILVVRLDRIGDVLLSTPVIKNLRDAYPQSYIAFMVRPYARDIVRGNPYLNDVIVYDKEGEESSFSGNLKFISYLREKRFDIAIILHLMKRTHLLMFLAGIPERVGYDKKMGALLTKRIPHTKHYGLKHEIDYSLAVLEYLGVDTKDHSLYMPLGSTSEIKAEELFRDNAIGAGEIVIALNPGASCASKRWPVSKFAEAADRLKEKYGARILIVASADDRAFGDEVHSSMRGSSINLSGATTISELASVLKRVKLFISNDSGPVHIACAVGTPVISIFGRSDPGLSPERWGPTGKCDIALHKPGGCEICLAHNCVSNLKCLEAITVNDVLAAAAKILGK
jgi:heptosyltransferase II